jgi:arginyl-tRNA synthetase
MRFSARDTVRRLLAQSLSAPPAIPVERPMRSEHGDFASNVALALGKPAGGSPHASTGWRPSRT